MASKFSNILGIHIKYFLSTPLYKNSLTATLSSFTSREGEGETFQKV
jgi:hypothetical protein